MLQDKRPDSGIRFQIRLFVDGLLPTAVFPHLLLALHLPTPSSALQHILFSEISIFSASVFQGLRAGLPLDV
jgi:hypothetical protein